MIHSPHAPDSPQVAGTNKNILAVASGKGGVGKTWFSITLAHAFAQLGRRALLFDGDLGMANVDIQLGLMPKRDLSAVLQGVISLGGATEHFAKGGFDIISGRSGTGSLASLPPQRLADLTGSLTHLAMGYDHVIIDLGAGIDRNVRQLAKQSGTLLVVTTEEPTALTDAYALIKVMRAMQSQADLNVVVNMATSLRDGERTYATLLKACATFLKMSPPLAGIVRHDRLVRESIRAQSPILIRSPHCDAAGDVAAIAARLAVQP
jgi:flagellar biosynthesis protein FlhG